MNFTGRFFFILETPIGPLSPAQKALRILFSFFAKFHLKFNDGKLLKSNNIIGFRLSTSSHPLQNRYFFPYPFITSPYEFFILVYLSIVLNTRYSHFKEACLS